jgi:adenylate kinase
MAHVEHGTKLGGNAEEVGMNKFIVLGPLGSGKSTQAALLARAYDLVHVNVGDILRWNIKNHTKLGARVRRLVDAGHLVPDGVVEEVIQRRLEEHDWNYGFILDGFPRNRIQAEFLLESYDVDATVVVDIPDAVVLMRVMSRRLCATCHLDYNLILHRPKVAHVCDICGGRLTTRADDNPEALRARLHDYHANTRAMLALFRARGLVIQVDGVKAADEVQSGIRSELMLPNPPVARSVACVS